MLPQLAAVSVSVALATVVWRNRESRGSLPLLATLVGAVGWSLTYAFQIANTALETKLFWNDLRYVFVLVTIVGYIAFAARYTSNDRWLRQPTFLALVFPAIVTVALVYTNDVHGLVRTGESLRTAGGTVVLSFDRGTWFWVYLAYVYVLMATAIFWITRFARRNWTIYRDQAITIVVAAIVPWFVNGLYVLEVTTVDYTAFGLSISAVAFVWAMYRYDLLDLVPIARERIIEEMRDGVLVLDIEDRIVDLNEAALPVLDADSETSVLGKAVVSTLAASPVDETREKWLADGHGHPLPARPGADYGGDASASRQRVNEPLHEQRDRREGVDRDGFETLVGLTLEDVFERDVSEKCTTEVTCTVDGKRRHYVLSLSPLHDGGGKITGRLVVAEDVTAIKRREHKLEAITRTLEERSHQLELRNKEQATLIENLPGVVYRCTGGPEERMTFVSSGAKALTGYSAAEFESGAVTVDSIIYPDDHETTRQQREIAIANRERFDVVYRIVTNDETQRWVRDIGKGVYDADGDLEFVEGFMLDVTENKQREQLQVLNRVLRHNIRNEMNVISGRLDLALASADEETRSHLEIVARAADRVTRLGTKARKIQGLLDADHAPEIERIDAVRTVEGAIMRFNLEYAREVTLETSLPGAVPVYGNEHLETAVYELLENAAVHGRETTPGDPTADGSDPTITVTVREPSSERAAIEISDDGPGIPSSELEAITGRMESPLVHGSGLGLWIVRWVVDAYGDLEIDSDEAGTTVTVRLRRVEETE
ncbi:sensor histidine kinase [Natronobiforma cellulositropha]